MWMLSVVVPDDLEDVIDDMVGEPAYLIQCWGKQVEGGTEFKYSFRGEVYAREAERRIQTLPQAKDLKVWNEKESTPPSNGHTSNEELSERVMSGDVEAAKEWLSKYPTAYVKNGWWYRKFPGGKTRRFSIGEHLTQNKAKELLRDD